LVNVRFTPKAAAKAVRRRVRFGPIVLKKSSVARDDIR
jgi:hypothetical protein